MKKILNVLKLMTFVLFIHSSQDIYACANAGKILVDTGRCDINMVTLRLTNHTTAAGTQYFWQMSNDGGVNFNTLTTNSGKDTQLVPQIIGRMYRCYSLCLSGGVYSDTITFQFQNRRITVDQIFCSAVAGGDDSVRLKIEPLNTATDTAFAKNFKWQYSTTNGSLWAEVPNSNSMTIKVKFTPNIIQYRGYVTFCALKGAPSTYPTAAPSLVQPINIGLNGIGLSISNKDCVNDTATLSLTNVTQSLTNFLKYRWYDSTSASGAFNYMNKSDSFIKVKVDSINRFYKASVKLCNTPFPSKDSLYTNTYAMWVKLGAFTANLNCLAEEISIDYSNRDVARKSVYLYWTRSQNDSLNHISYTAPVDSISHTIPLVNNTNYYYKVYSKFCNSSTKILDSSYNLNVKLKIDTGQLKADLVACPNDSVYMKLNNYKDSSSFPLIKKWMIKPNGSSIWLDYTQAPITDTSITFRMANGLNLYRKSVALCADKYAKKWSSTEASTFLPYQPVFSAACTSSMTINVLNDTVKVKDYTGTTIRSNSTFAYQWIKSTNKSSSSIVAGATSATLPITQADRNAFFKRLVRLCSANTFSDTSNWSNTVVAVPNSVNGRAEVVEQICLNDSVKICVANAVPRGTDTPTFVWQYSPDDINWTNINNNNSNDTCFRTIVGPQYQYYRRLTYWCPSGIIDSTISTPVIYIRSLPWLESFSSQVQFNKDIYYSCWRGSTPVCGTYSPTYLGGQFWSRATGGKSSQFISNWGPAPADPKNPPGRRADMKVITPAFNLQRGKIYRFSFWHKEDASNLCWDSLYVTWGNKPTPCDMTNKFGEQITKFSFDGYVKFWSDFIPQDDGIYYFAINLREQSQTTGEVGFDEIGLKEIEPCGGKIVTGGKRLEVIGGKTIDRFEDPMKKQGTYDKEDVAHAYCIDDIVGITFPELEYANGFDYYGMTYQFYKRRSDADWKVEDTFFKPIPSNDFCHINNRTNYHAMNVLVTDTHTWYKIVATCQFDGKEYHTDSLLINGTHSVPYCEDWESVGTISQQMPPVSACPAGNTGQIIGRSPEWNIPTRTPTTVPTNESGFSFCPTCWSAFPQPPSTPTGPPPAPNAADFSFCSASLPLRNPPPGPPAIPQVDPESGYKGPTVVMNTDCRAANITRRKVLVMPAMRLYKGRGYRVSYRWTDNRKPQQSPWGNITQDLDSIYLVVTKHAISRKTVDSFNKNKMVPGSLYRNVQTNVLESGTNRYRTFWADYSPNDTGTYYFGFVVVPRDGNPYRFVMDYFCVDTIPIDDCNAPGPKFVDPLRVRVAPDGKTWSPGDTSIGIPGVQWCVGNGVNLEFDFGQGPDNNWKHGWKYYWQKTTNEFAPRTWTTIDSSNNISYVLTNKYQDYRLILSNSCKTKFDTIGPFGVRAYRGLTSCVVGSRETFLNESFGFNPAFPQCWDYYPTTCNRATVKNGLNEFGLGAKLDDNYIDMDFISASGPCPLVPKITVVPPGYSATGGTTYRFSFWYRDNGISMPVDSIVAGYSLSRPTEAIQVRLINRVLGDVVKNSQSNKWRYYTTEVTPTVDTGLHFKISTFNSNTAKRIYRTMFDDFMFKPKQAIDALVIAIDSPEYECALSSNTGVKVTVMNIGSSTLPNIPVNIQVGSLTPVSYTVPGPFVSNQSKTVVVPGVNLSALGANVVKAWTEVSGEQFACDDTFTTVIYHNDMPVAPLDTIDTVCICQSNVMYSPYSNSRWYRNATDITPLLSGPSFTMDSICKDTSIYYSTWNGLICNTKPYNFSAGSPTYSNALGGLAFDNISQDTIMIDSVMIYANTLGTSSINFTKNGVTFATVPASIAKLGRQWLPIKVKIAPGTDYKIIYQGGGGAAALATLPNYIYIGDGCTSLKFNILGDDTYPVAATSYKYFFNMKLIKIGCESPRVRKNIIVVPSPIFKLHDTARVCSRPIYQVCGPVAPTGQVYSYLWNFGDTTQCRGALTSGWYNLTVTNNFGCHESDSFELLVDPSPIFTLGPDTSFCRFTPYTLSTGLDSNNAVVTWSDNQSGVNIKILNPGTYVATAYNTVNFCTSKDTINVIRRELPVFSLGTDRVFCGDNADLAALAPNLPSNLSYTWKPGSPLITSTGTYWVTGVDNFGCQNSDTIIATLIKNPILDLGSDRDVCGSTTTVDGPVGNYYYAWSTTATSRSLTIAQPGKYFLTITDKTYGCQTVDSINITFKTVPVFDLGSNVVKCATTHLIQGPTIAGNYRWKKPNGTYGAPSLNSFIADESGVYYLKVDNDCYEYEDSILITLKKPPLDAIDMLRDTFGCKSVILRATSTTNYSDILWNDPLSTKANLLRVDKSGTYSVSLTNECGTASKAATVRIDSTPIADFSVGYLDSLRDCMSIVLRNLSKNAISYQWSFGDTKTSTVENPLHTYTQEGDYLVTLKAFNSCGYASKTLPIKRRDLACSALSISNPTLGGSQVYVFPNPAKESTQLLGLGLPNGVYGLSIQSILGQTVYESEVRIVNGELEKTLDLSKFAAGDYLVNLIGENDSKMVKLQVIR